MASWLGKYSGPLIVALAALLAGAIVALAIEHGDNARPLEITVDGTPGAGGAIQVYISGAVAQPGVYEMQNGDRAVDLLYKAGGPAQDANLDGVNLAVRLRDEQQIVVPRAGETIAVETSQVAGVSTGPPVNINTASAAELDALPGVGAVYSQRIVDSRTTDGPYSTTDDLVGRSLIPRATYDRIRDMITVGP